MNKAQVGWNQSREGRWMMADEAAEVVGNSGYSDKDAQRFGRDLRPPVSEDTVYRLARAGRTFATLRKFNPVVADKLREFLTDNYFDAIGKRIEKNMSVGEAIEWLMEAVDDKQNIEKFRVEISQNRDAEIDWTKEDKYIERHYIHFPALGLTDGQYRKIRRAAKLLQGRIRQIETRGGNDDNLRDSGE